MLNLVFTFEAMAARSAVQTSAQLAQALRLARAGEPIAYETIACEEIPGCDDVHAQVAVLFSDLRQLDGFTARLTCALLPSGIAIADLCAPSSAKRE